MPCCGAANGACLPPVWGIFGASLGHVWGMNGHPYQVRQLFCGRYITHTHPEAFLAWSMLGRPSLRSHRAAPSSCIRYNFSATHLDMRTVRLLVEQSETPFAGVPPGASQKWD